MILKVICHNRIELICLVNIYLLSNDARIRFVNEMKYE